MDRWIAGKAGLKIAYIKKQSLPVLWFAQKGANLYSKLAVAPFLCKKEWSWMNGWVDGWMDGWVGGGAGLKLEF